MLNSGTFLGPSRMLVAYIDAMLEEFQQRWHCLRLHGSDQAVHNFLMYTGKFIGTGVYMFEHVTALCVMHIFAAVHAHTNGATLVLAPHLS